MNIGGLTFWPTLAREWRFCTLQTSNQALDVVCALKTRRALCFPAIILGLCRCWSKFYHCDLAGDNSHPSVRLLRRTGIHPALAAFNLLPFLGTVVVLWGNAYDHAVPVKGRT